mgnify:CR=1 FL=1
MTTDLAPVVAEAVLDLARWPRIRPRTGRQRHNTANPYPNYTPVIRPRYGRERTTR